MDNKVFDLTKLFSPYHHQKNCVATIFLFNIPQKDDLNKTPHMFNKSYHYSTKFQDTTSTLVSEWKTQMEVLKTGI